MARVLKPLGNLAAAAQRALGGTKPADVAEAYLERGWQADLGAWQAVATAPISDEVCVAAAVRHLLQPWLEESARAFQAALQRAPLPGDGGQPPVDAGGRRLPHLRRTVCGSTWRNVWRNGWKAVDSASTWSRRWAALPTVTGTGKPAVTPVAGEIEGDVLGQSFGARMRDGGKPADRAGPARGAGGCAATRFSSVAMAPTPLGPIPRGAGWRRVSSTRSGTSEALQLARDLEREMERVADRIERVLDAGWTSVRVVTDHGWLLLPGGLPKVDLPKHLTESRWARCAVIAGESVADVIRAPWHWNGAQWFATPPGIACFNRSEEYTHGGLEHPGVSHPGSRRDP